MTVTLNGADVYAAEIRIPTGGRWHARATVGDDIPIEVGGSATLVFEDETFEGTIVDALDGECEIVSGTGGLGAVLPALGFNSTAGVQLLTVLATLAAAALEVIEPPLVVADLGTHYATPKGPGFDVLNDVLGAGEWYARPNGAIVPSRRTGSELGDHVVTSYDLDRAQLKPSNFSEVTPGTTIAIAGKSFELGSVTLNLRDGHTSAAVEIGARSDDRLREAARRFVRSSVDSRFFAIHRYRVVTMSIGLEINLQSVSSEMPDLESVPAMPGVAGGFQEPALGSTCLVAFIGGKRSEPRILAFETPTNPGGIPVRAGIDADRVDLGVGAHELLRAGCEVLITPGTVSAGTVTGRLTITAPPILALPAKVFG